MQKSNKNEIFMARVKSSNCLKFCTQVDPSKTRKTVYFFPQMCFFFPRKTNVTLATKDKTSRGVAKACLLNVADVGTILQVVVKPRKPR